RDGRVRRGTRGFQEREGRGGRCTDWRVRADGAQLADRRPEQRLVTAEARGQVPRCKRALRLLRPAGSAKVDARLLRAVCSQASQPAKAIL
ncbi:hypothetical protein EMIHUDRAFT_255177, partial [Emiliania huxleyi CCMP1516]|uniref:Uncharacterized protein n=2 Tax=Emiliania huxleyi TaxID=2903 RepID=A0A0D3JEJ7_EMIH1